MVMMLCITQTTNAKVTKFFFEKSELNRNWYFIDEFCFDNEGEAHMGTLSWNLSKVNPNLLVNLTIAFYMDKNWEKLQRDLYNSNYKIPCNQVVSTNYTPYIVNLHDNPVFTYSVRQTLLPRYWYLVLGACERDGNQFKKGRREFIEMDVTWLNPGTIFERQFSKDRHGIYASLIAFTPIFTLMSLAYTFSVFMLIRAKCFHWIIRVFYGSLLLYTASCWLELFHNIKYSYDGYGIPFFDVLSTSFRIIAELAFMMLLYLIASGWTVTQPYLRHMKQLLCIFVALLVLYVSMFAWSQVSLAIYITTTDYVYETLPGVVLGVLRIPALGFFIYALKTTYKKEVSQVKLWFYRIFSAYSLWFLVLPLLIIIAFLLKPAERAKWIEGLSRAIEFISYFFMMILLWYSRARKYFALSEDESKHGMYEDL